MITHRQPVNALASRRSTNENEGRQKGGFWLAGDFVASGKWRIIFNYVFTSFFFLLWFSVLGILQYFQIICYCVFFLITLAGYDEGK